VLVHHVNHPVAKSPKGEQENEQNKGEEDILAVISNEHFLFRGGARIIEGHRVISGGDSIHDSGVCSFASWKVSFIIVPAMSAVKLKTHLILGSRAKTLSEIIMRCSFLMGGLTKAEGNSGNRDVDI
jgi:hypothetical protein